MASEQTSSTSPGSWFVLWGMLLLSIWMAPAPDAIKRLMVARGLLVLLALGSAVAASLRVRDDDATGARSGFVRCAGALVLAVGLWATGAPLVIETVSVRAVVLALAGRCPPTSFVMDLLREPA